MLNDRDDDKYEGHEESEYHFSDDDINYEVESETETAKPASTAPAKESLVTRLSRSKRLIISIIVFIALVFIIYKMVEPSTPTSTVPVFTAPPQNTQAVVPTPQQPPIQQGQMVSPSGQPVVATNQPPMQPQMNQQVIQPVGPTTGTITTTPVTTGAPTVPTVVGPAPTTTMVTPPQQTVTTITQTPTAPTVQGTLPQTQTTVTPPQQQVIPGQVQPMQPTNEITTVQTIPRQVPIGQPVEAQHPLNQQLPSQQQVAQPNVQQPPQIATMPSVIPVQSAVPTYQQPQTSTTVTTLTNDSERLMNQLQAQYEQKLGEYGADNKNLQSQVQMLTAKVSTLETQMNQLIQIISRQQQQPPVQAAPPPPPPPPPQQLETRVSYTVQAIIPGRAWLKSESGETVTVAEGDVIRDLGRVTKIDPYDGVVEINTGSKVISLTYGSSG